jgi:hypothetical protein
MDRNIGNIELAVGFLYPVYISLVSSFCVNCTKIIVWYEN